MCGIAGSWGSAPKTTVRQMLDKICHRGPDGDGLLSRPGVQLGQQRLAIVDVPGGGQPLFGEEEVHALVSNSEIYNFPALRQELEASHDFSTQSDSEVILHLLEESGPESVSRLDGMFSFGATDGRDLFLARDPVGVKPLYYGEAGGSWYFASEIKALLGTVEDVLEFPPGTWFSTKAGFHEYYHLPRPRPLRRPWEYHAGRLRDALHHAVRKRLMSDVPVGVFLSGGLDSSLIAAIARRHVPRLPTFAVGVSGSSDLEAARLVASHLGTDHHEFILTCEEIRERLPEIIYHLESFDRDLVRSAIPCYFVSRLASGVAKVVLTGEGADELFAGYRYHRRYKNPEVLQEELTRSIAGLHNVNLQRVDRMTMAHAVEGRVPFLDPDVMETAMAIPAEYKIRIDENGERVNKWILRKAFEDLLPPEILWRGKEQFDEGSGTVDLLNDALYPLAVRLDEKQAALRCAPWRLRSPEEILYRTLLHEVFEQPLTLEKLVARWSEGRIEDRPPS